VGGVERHVEDLCRNLVELGHRSDVACLDSCAKKKEKLPSYEEYRGIRIYRLPFVDLGLYKIAPGILKLIKGYDLIHVHGLGFFSDFLAVTSFFHRRPLIISTHGGVFHTRTYSLLKRIYFDVWCRFVLKKYRVIAVSRSDARLFSSIGARAEYIPNAIEVEDLLKIKRTPEENTLLFVGRISRNKRIDNLIDTVFLLKKKIPNVRLYVVGEDWEGIEGYLKKLVKEKNLEDNVIFTGGVSNREELLGYYGRAKFFVSASEYEGFGISVLEAMVAGCVVIVNDIEAFRELVRDGENGFIVDYSNKKTADIISELMQRDLTTISREARKMAETHDWKKTVKKIEKLYHSVL
jgi:alpha-1,3-mannosyltransferase